MIKILYVPPGAGSNFLANHLLWEGKPPGWEGRKPNHNTRTNEYSIEREILDPLPKGAIEEAQKFLSGKKQELEKRIESKAILESYDDLPFWDYMMFAGSIDFNDKWTHDFFRNVTNLFIRVYEKYGLTCNRITHYHYNAYLNNIKKTDYVKHLNVYLDKDSLNLCKKLSWKKSRQRIGPDINNVETVENSENVEYSKIFFDLDEQEIRKLFVHFNKQAYFDNHKYDIIYEFKKYTEENRRLTNAR